MVMDFTLEGAVGGADAVSTTFGTGDLFREPELSGVEGSIGVQIVRKGGEGDFVIRMETRLASARKVAPWTLHVDMSTEGMHAVSLQPQSQYRLRIIETTAGQTYDIWVG